MRQNNIELANISVDMTDMDANIASGVTATEAANYVEDVEGTTLLLDVRPFIAYNNSHLLDAQNVNCPPILKRRSNGFINLENIVTCERRRRLLVNSQYQRVIVYDADTSDLTQSAKDSNLYPVLKSLRQQVDIEKVYFITGKILLIQFSKNILYSNSC